MPTTAPTERETDRIRRYTAPETLQQIDQQIERNVAYYASQPDAVIAQRIADLKREWSINRCLQANVATVGFMGAFFGLVGHRKWALVTATAFSFFLYHGLKGWDPPVPLLRRLGFRTRSEIDRELYALKVARGDFRNLPAPEQKENGMPVKEILKAVNA